jgi:hypothetical protein
VLRDDRSAFGVGDRAAVNISELVASALRRQATMRVKSTAAIVQVAELW